MRYAVDLGGTHVRVSAAQSGCEWQYRHRSRRTPGMTPTDFVGILSALIDDWETGWPTAIGVSVAAVVDNAGCLLASENLGWKDVPLKKILSDSFSCPVFVETDVFCGATYEARAGVAVGMSSALYIGIGTGVGHAVIIDGRVWPGSNRGANAFGHIIINPAGDRCYCGHRGCLCTVASGLAQADRRAGLEADTAPLEYLALAIGNAVTLIEPEAIILSGGALNQPWFDLAQLTQLIPTYSYPSARQPRLIHSHAVDPNLCGALLLSMEQS